MSSESETIRISDQRWIWWAAASSAQILGGVAWLKRGYAGNGSTMPLKAFGAATLFVSGLASAVTASFSASGFHSMEDAKDAGERLRRWMGAPPKRLREGDRVL